MRHLDLFPSSTASRTVWPGAEQEKLEKQLASADASTLDTQLEIAADALRLPPWDAKVDTLSGGEKRRT